MSEALSPQREAIKLAQLWRAVHGLSFPVRAGLLAQEWSKQVAPQEPIEDVLSQDLEGFEGGLFWLPNREVWALLYRPHEGLPGRSNFTIAHEFGHYVLHRKLQRTFRCSQNETLGASGIDMERQADQFASFLLMPIDDFRTQVHSRRMTLDFIGTCAGRYEVSLTAAILKWLTFTDQAAIVVTAREGMILWWRASDSAKKIAFGRLREGMELPAGSLASMPSGAISTSDFRLGVDHRPGVWFTGIPVREMVVVSDRYDMTISLLILDVPGVVHDEEPDADMTTQLPTF